MPLVTAQAAENQSARGAAVGAEQHLSSPTGTVTEQPDRHFLFVVVARNHAPLLTVHANMTKMAIPSTHNAVSYQPLDPSRRQIRLIEIDEPITTGLFHRRNPKQKLSCRLKTVSLDDNPHFTALSYVWGPPPWQDDIIVDGALAKVPTHLADALRHVQVVWRRAFPGRDASSFRLWTDALCINQSDTEEKKHQVGLMGTIYSSAELVIGWLPGPDTTDEKRCVWETTMKHDIGAIRALDAEMQQIVGRKLDLAELPRMRDNYPALINTARTNAHTVPRIWKPASRALDRSRGLELFCSSEYWTRVWVAQEVVLARRLVVATARDSIDFESVTRVVAWKASSVRQWNKQPAISELIGPLDSFDRILRLAELKATKMSGGALPTLLFQAARISAFAMATDPRDSVYGLLGVTGLSIAADYAKEYRDVLVEFFQACMQTWSYVPCSPYTIRVPQLALLAYSGTCKPHRIEGLPSWMPNFRAAMGEHDGGGITADVCPDWRAGTDIANGAAPAPTIRGLSLVITGIILGKAQYPTHHSIDTELPTTPLNSLPAFRELYLKATQGHSPARTGMSSLRAFFRLFVSWQHWSRDAWTEMQWAFWFAQLIEPMTPVEFADAFLLPHEKNGMETEQWVEQHRREGGLPFWNEKMGAYARQVLAREIALHWGGWGVFRSSEGYLGRCPMDATMQGRNDAGSETEGHEEYLAVVCGYGAPVLLRKREEHFILVGSCIVPGLMDGEIQPIVQSGEYQLVSLEMR